MITMHAKTTHTIKAGRRAVLKTGKVINKNDGNAYNLAHIAKHSGLMRRALHYLDNDGYGDFKAGRTGFKALHDLVYDNGADIVINIVSSETGEQWIDFDGTPVKVRIDKELGEKILYGITTGGYHSLEDYIIYAFKTGLERELSKNPID